MESLQQGISPSNRRYLDKELYDFIVSLMREAPTNYHSDLRDLVRNEVVRDQLKVFKACVGRRK